MRDGAVAPDVTMTDLITLIVGIVLATEHHPDPAAAGGPAVPAGRRGAEPRARIKGMRGPGLVDRIRLDHRLRLAAPATNLRRLPPNRAGASRMVRTRCGRNSTGPYSPGSGRRTAVAIIVVVTQLKTTTALERV